MSGTSITRIPLARLLLLGGALSVLSACASVPPNQGIMDAQTRLSAASNDKLTAERGQGDLANARTALGSASADWAHGDRDRADHQLSMATTYLDLAETRGRQAGVEQETARLSSDAQMAGKNRTIAVRDRQIANRDELVAAQNHEIASQSRTLASRDADLAAARAQLAQSDMKVSELGSTMVLQDVSFETGKSVLLPGGVNRLQPLINYLRLSPDTRVRIEGFTDSVGGTAYNQQLSLDRANSVRAMLTSAGIDGARIDTLGSGLDKPLATNGTPSGRQSNRRVEITLLKVSGI